MHTYLKSGLWKQLHYLKIFKKNYKIEVTKAYYIQITSR